MPTWLVRTTTGGAVLALALGLLALGTAAGRPHPASAPDTGASSVPPTRELPVARLQRTVQDLPGNYPAWTQLGMAQLERARTTADPSAYAQAESAFAAALRLRPADADALAGAAALAGARHDFAGALRLADRALTQDPYNGPAQAIRTDALVELGRYGAARQSAQRQLDVHPGTSAFSRAAYLRELAGDTAGAAQALQSALDAGALGSDRSFLDFQLGQLAWQRGDLPGAAAQYAAALQSDPSNAAASAGRAQVLAAQGRGTDAVALYQDVVTRLPLPEHLTRLGELLDSLGRHDQAQQQYAVVRAIEQLYAAAGADVDTELALFEADHGSPVAAVRAAERAYRKRPDAILTEDAYAWALHAAGRDRQALALAQRAVRLGTQHALLRYHLGVIQLAVGAGEQGRGSLRAALHLNPAFSPLQAPTARRLLAQR